jgi:regulator of RNase E activity RraA
MEALERLRRLDTCAVSDALDRLSLSGVLRGVRPLTGPAAARTLAGRAVTVQLGPAEAGALRSGRHLGTAAADAAGPDDVILVAHEGRTDCAGWGGLLSRAAARRGVAAIVVDGAVRDVPEAQEADLAVHGLLATPVSARGRVVEQSWGERVVAAGVAVAPGDLVLADGNGVVVVPADRAESVLAAADEIAAAEQAMAQAIGAGLPVSQVMGTSYEELTRG